MREIWLRAFDTAAENMQAEKTVQEGKENTAPEGGAEFQAWNSNELKRTYIAYSDFAKWNKAFVDKAQSLINRGKTVKVTAGEAAAQAKKADWNDLSAARKYIRKTLQSMFGTNSVRFVDRGTAVEAYLTKDGRKHSAASVTNEEEAAAMMKAHELIANAEYVFSSKHDPHSERGKNIPPDTVWDYFEAVAEFGTVTMPVRFTLCDITDDVREQLYKIGINEKEVSPNNRAPKKARLVDRGETSF